MEYLKKAHHIEIHIRHAQRLIKRLGNPGSHGIMKWISGNTDGFIQMLRKIIYRFQGKTTDLWVGNARWHKGTSQSIPQYVEVPPNIEAKRIISYCGAVRSC